MKTARIPIRLKRGKNELRIKNNNKGCSEWVSDNEPIRLRP